jgi:hypothetical protein
MSTKAELIDAAEEVPAGEKCEFNAMRVVTWFSAGVAVAALGIFLGTELRNRYRFRRRTPYDFYANAGETQAGEFGVGI